MMPSDSFNEKSEASELLHCLPNQPVYMGVTENLIVLDEYIDQRWVVSKEGIIQLKDRLDIAKLYEKSHNSGAVGQIWRRHHCEFAEFIKKHAVGGSVLELGGGHGILHSLLSDFANLTDDWTIIEPGDNTKKQGNLKLINKIFDDSTVLGRQYDVIIHSHLFEHLYEPVKTVKNLNNHMSGTGRMCFSLPNMKRMVEKGYVNSINFEHTIFLPEDLVEEILNSGGFQIIEKQYFMDDHSIFYCCKHNYSQRLFDYNAKQDYRALIKNLFVDREAEIADLNRKIELIQGRSVYLFGAHIFSQYLVSNGLETYRVKGILDNDKTKQGKRLYGTELIVRSPTILKNEDAAVVLRAGAYNDEIKSQLLTINNATIVI